jgi:hypothetical protein
LGSAQAHRIAKNIIPAGICMWRGRSHFAVCDWPASDRKAPEQLRYYM